jgi:hypothetical protein
MVWIKQRTAIASHYLFDSVRGAYKGLRPNLTNAENNLTSVNKGLTSFDNNGFTVNDDSDGSYEVNGSPGGLYSGNGTYVSWNFKAGGAAVAAGGTNITNRLVSANPEAGFSIMTYTGVNTDGTIEHGLNQKPEFWVFKNRTLNGKPWFTLTTAIDGSVDYAFLNTTDAFASGAAQYVTNTVIGVNTDGGTGWLNQSGSNYVCYAFHSVEGFSKFGSYAGTGAAGNSIVTGFEPAFVMIKRTNGISDWNMWDNKRGNQSIVWANGSNAEATNAAYEVAFNENGFTVNATANFYNGSGDTYIYMAFAADPTAVEPSLEDSFNTVLYSGNSSTQSITGVGFQPDFTWIKSRNASWSNMVTDSVTGGGLYLSTNTTNAQAANSSAPTFDSDGFTLGGGNTIWNGSGLNYVSWNWKGAEIPAINSNGSIPSVVSANPAAGFSIVSYTGSGSATTIGHGLSSAPSFVIYKDRDNASVWLVQAEATTNASQYLYLNAADAYASYINYFYTTTPSTFGLQTGDPTTNAAGRKYIAYCFAEVAGFSKFGSYTGNGVARTIALDFTPAFVMIKRTGTTGSWQIFDNKRSTYRLIPNSDSQEQQSAGTNDEVTLIANGFTLPTDGGNGNNSALAGNTYIYMAFANQF